MSENENIDNVNDIGAENEENKLNLDVQINEVSTCERHIVVTISRDDVDRYIEKEYAELKDTAAVPGFRIGKAPRKLLEKRFKSDVAQRVKGNLLVDSLSQIGEKKEFTAISEPDFDFNAVVVPDEGPFIFEYDIEVRPEFDVPNWKGLQLERLTREFTDKNVDEAMEELRVSAGHLEISDEPAKLDDYIVCSLRFTRDGEQISFSPEETIRIRPVLSFRDSAIKDFDKLMEGAVAGDVRTTKTRLSIDTPNAFLSGVEVEAEFTITAVKKLVLPEMSLEFVRQYGDFDSMADFRDLLKDTLEMQFEYERKQHLRDQVANFLVVDANWQLPQKLLERQAKRELNRALLEMRRDKLDENRIQAELNRMSRSIMQTTAKALKQHFILERIAELESIDADPQDYDIEILRIAAQSGESPRKLRADLERKGDMDIIRNQIIERKVLEMIVAEANIVDKVSKPEIENEEALDLAASGQTTDEDDIPDVTEEEAREVARKEAEKHQIPQQPQHE